jgi:hypothetical protein
LEYGIIVRGIPERAISKTIGLIWGIPAYTPKQAAHIDPLAVSTYNLLWISRMAIPRDSQPATYEVQPCPIL